MLNIRAKKMKPTKKHRPAIWEAILGTVCAMNDEGEVEYFDYNYAAAKKFANLKNKKDVRLARADAGIFGYDDYQKPHNHQSVIWVEK